jgi:hypothetical protein
MGSMTNKYKNPINGDPMTFGEMAAWKLQGIIRRWWFLLSYTAITVVCWVFGGASVLLWWNLASSFLAIVVEGVVGRAMFAVTKTDSAVIREIRKLNTTDTDHSLKDYQIDLETREMVKQILEILSTNFKN